MPKPDKCPICGGKVKDDKHFKQYVCAKCTWFKEYANEEGR